MIKYDPIKATDFFFLKALEYENRAIDVDGKAAIAFARGDTTSKTLMDRSSRDLRDGAAECLAAAVDFEPVPYRKEGIA